MVFERVLKRRLSSAKDLLSVSLQETVQEDHREPGLLQGEKLGKLAPTQHAMPMVVWQSEQLAEQLAAQWAQLWARRSALLAQQSRLLPPLRQQVQVMLGMAHQWAPASLLLKA